MKHLLIKTGIQTYKYLVRSIEDKVKPSSRISVTRESYINTQEKLMHKPMFTRYYVVKVILDEDPRYNEWIFSKLLSQTWVQCIFFASTGELFDKAAERLRKFDYVEFDCYKVSVDVLTKYIIRQIYELSGKQVRLSKTKADLIRRRIKYQEYQLDSKISLLVSSDLSIKTIERIIPKYKGVKLATLPYHFFIGKKQSEVASFLCRYQRYSKTVYDPIVKFVDKWLLLYEIYLSGELSQNNYIEWMLASGKGFDIKYQYQMERWLELIYSTSYERLMWIKLQLLTVKDSCDFDRIFLLYKLLRSMEY